MDSQPIKTCFLTTHVFQRVHGTWKVVHAQQTADALTIVDMVKEAMTTVATSENASQAENTMPRQLLEEGEVLSDEQKANNFLRGTWIGSDNRDQYIFTGSQLIKQTEEGEIVIRVGYKVFFAGQVEIRLKFEDGSKGSILKIGDELLFGKETLKKISNSIRPIH